MLWSGFTKGRKQPQIHKTQLNVKDYIAKPEAPLMKEAWIPSWKGPQAGI